jgi:hypothetical protein
MYFTRLSIPRPDRVWRQNQWLLILLLIVGCDFPFVVRRGWILHWIEQRKRPRGDALDNAEMRLISVARESV